MSAHSRGYDCYGYLYAGYPYAVAPITQMSEERQTAIAEQQKAFAEQRRANLAF